MNDLVSIIMPSYNAEKYIKKSIESIINQTYRNWELIIIDDCSLDNTIDIIKSFDDSRIKYYINDRNLGAALSRNRALKEAKGRWIAFLDSDDLWVQEKLDKQINYMKKNNFAFTYTDYRICLNGKWEKWIRTAPSKVTRRKLYNWCYFSTITVIYDASIVGLIQIEDLKKNNDYAMWFKALEKVDAYRLGECLSYYIKHDDSISGGSKLKLIKHHYKLFRNGLYYNPVASFLLTINNVFWGFLKKYTYREVAKEEFPCLYTEN